MERVGSRLCFCGCEPSGFGRKYAGYSVQPAAAQCPVRCNRGSSGCKPPVAVQRGPEICAVAPGANRHHPWLLLALRSIWSSTFNVPPPVMSSISAGLPACNGWHDKRSHFGYNWQALLHEVIQEGSFHSVILFLAQDDFHRLADCRRRDCSYNRLGDAAG